MGEQLVLGGEVCLAHVLIWRPSTYGATWCSQVLAERGLYFPRNLQRQTGSPRDVNRQVRTFQRRDAPRNNRYSPFCDSNV